MPVPSFAEMMFLCLAVGAAQLVITLRFFLRMRRDLLRAETYKAVPVSVIVPCKGVSEGMNENIGSILRQEYPAPAEFILVVPSKADPAYGRLQEIARDHPASDITLLSSEAVPARCSEQILNMLHGVRNASPAAEAFVFADSDIKVPPGWLLNMAGPLAEPGVSVVTAPLVFPPAGGLCALLRAVWVALGVPYLELNGCVAGASFSILKKNFAALGVEKLWGGALNNDLSLAASVKKAGGRVRFACRAMPVSSEKCGFGQLLRMFNKWMFHFKFYFPSVWAMGAALTAFKFYAVFWGAARGWTPALVLLGLDALQIYCALRVLRSRFPEECARPGVPGPSALPLISVLAAPPLQLLYAANFITSFFSERLRWGGYTYRVDAAGRVEVEKTAGPQWSPGAFAAVLAAGVMTGVCFLPVGAGWMFWFILVPFFWVIMSSRPSGAFLYGWLFGFAAWAAGLHWLPGPLAGYLRIPYPAALILFVCVCAWHGLTFALLGWASRAGSAFLSERLGWGAGAALLFSAAPAMSAIEGFFPRLFPVYFASSQYFRLPLLQVSELTGPAGLLWLTLGFNIAFYLLLRAYADRRAGSAGAAGGALRARAAFFCAACCLVLLCDIYGQARMRAVDERVREAVSRGRVLRAAVVQGSVPLGAPPGANNEAALSLYRGMTAVSLAKDKPDVVIWPESVYGRFAEFSAAGGKYGFTTAFAETLRRDIPEKAMMIMNSRAELVGSADDGSRTRFNSVYAVSPDKEMLGIVLKRRLFPFGEFIPGGNVFPWLYRLIPAAEGLTPAGEPEPLSVKGAKWGALICYEDLYADTAGVFVRKGADVLLDVSNEIGFGYGGAPPQHLMYSALRAVENRKFFIRAANTGISAVFDPCGRLLDSVETGRRGTMTAEAALLDGSTFYSRHDELFRFSGVLLLAAIFLFAMIKPAGTRI